MNREQAGLFSLLIAFACLSALALIVLKWHIDHPRTITPDLPHTLEQMHDPDEVNSSQGAPIKKWQCHNIVTCPNSDWRYTKPEDVCIYRDEVLFSPTDPTNYASYGAHCEESDIKG